MTKFHIYDKQGNPSKQTFSIEEIKKMGVKILWIMPVHPIGIEKRKEGLGSYYSVKDYRSLFFVNLC